MSKPTLYFCPLTCSRVTMTALEEIGVDYDAVLVDLREGEQRSDRYLAINARAEVPSMQFEGRTFTQNAAILHFLAQRYPEANLLPATGGTIGANQTLEDLIWCSSTLHILRRQIANPARFTEGPHDSVKASGMAGFGKALATISDRVEGGRWWYGTSWSILDTYISWSFSDPIREVLDIPSRPILLDYEQRACARPAFRRALEREPSAPRLRSL